MTSQMTREHQRDFWVLTVGQFLLFCGFFTYFQFPLFIKALGGAEREIGIMMGVQTLASTILLPWVSPMMARANLKLVMLGGTALAAVSTLACMTLTSAGLWMAALMILRGLGFSLFMNASGTYVARILPPRERSKWIGISFGFNQVAIAVGPALGEFAIAEAGFNGFFLTALGIILLGMLSQWAIRAIPPGTGGEMGMLALPVHFFRVLVGSRQLFFVFCALLPLAATLGAVFSFSATFLAGMGLTSGMFFLFYAILNAITRFGGGGLSDRFGRARIIVPTLAIFVGGVTMYSFTDGLGWMIVSASIIGFGFGFCNPAMSAQMLDEAAPQDQNIAVGGFQFGYNLGMIVSTPVMGVVTEAFGYQVMFRAAAGMAVLSMAIYVIGELTRKPRPAEK